MSTREAEGAVMKSKLTVVNGAAAKWNPRTWGTLEDPVHKSHISSLIGEFACSSQFRRDRERECRGEDRETIAGKTAMGTAGHETIARALRKPEMRERILGGEAPPVDRIRGVVESEFLAAVEGLDVVWYNKTSYPDSLEEITSMVLGLLSTFAKHVAAVELVEAGFIAPLGKWWTEGHVDLIYRSTAAPHALAQTDWKTGATKPHPIELDHGFEAGFYSAAMKHGYFLPTDVLATWRAAAQRGETRIPFDSADVFEESELAALAKATSDRAAMHVALRAIGRRNVPGKSVWLPPGVVHFGEFPEVIRLTHLADFVPYEKKGKKKITRPEEIAHWGLDGPGEVQYEKGMARGPGWYNVRTTEHDLPRLEARLRTIVGLVRMGMFVDSVGEKCTRCTYREPCLNGGYELRGDEGKALAKALGGVDLGTELSLDD